jgi:hypothetical protein
MADQGIPGPPAGPPADLANLIAATAALVHLEETTRGGPPVAPPRHEPKQQRRPGPAHRDHKGRFRRRV